MGFNVGKLGKSLGKVAGAVVGGITGGPGGALAGLSGGFSSGLSGLSGWDFVQGAVGLGQDELAAQQQWKYSKMASDYAFNQNLKMWNMQNAYNDPAAQMARLIAAGLNPNLVYGGGNVTGNTSGSAPTYDTPKVTYEDRSVQRQQLQLALAEHQQRVTNQAIENDLARQRLVLEERAANRNDALADAQIKAYAANLGLRDAEITNIGNLQEYRNRTLAQRQYNADLALYQRRYDALKRSYFGRLMTEAEFERYALKNIGRKPMFADYFNSYKSF